MTDATAELSPAAFGRRAAALLAASSEHLPRVLDVTLLGRRRELVLEDVAGPTLAELLGARRRLPPGEAVTIVISAVRAVTALHNAGYCGVQLGAELVAFDDAGTPMLLGLDEVAEIVLTGTQGPAEDWRAVAALADRLGLVAHGRAAGALGPAHVGLGLALATLTAGESEQAIERLESALFELAEPEPVRLDGVVAPPSAPAQSPLAERRRTAAHRRPSSSMLIEAFDAGPSALLARPVAEARARLRAAAGRVQGRARVFMIGLAIAAGLTIVAVALLPSHTSDGGSVQPGAQPPSAPVPAATAAATPSPTAASDAALMGGDPVAAVAVLVARRDACLKLAVEAGKSCLAAVADGQASDLTQPARPLAGLAPSLLERTGDSALIALTPKDRETAPASALMMRTEAGWRLRQLYEN
ncbi:hypothetical protein GCM10022286_05050 [Gryllotalpicola daejeonensis]|uniref:Protein kinase domain-containing protein n=1 Tax=Gryllotalpicola daejeonensis TaxID=993087 RepID=A0ABP7ZF67_9MICO